MGLFGGGYQKEGPGVAKNGAEKRRFFLFFELYFRKFWKIIKLNMLYFVVNILSVLAITVLIQGILIPQEAGVIDGVSLIAYGVLVLSGIIAGPSTAAMVYVLRNYANQHHSFMVSDFFEQFKSNFKQAAPIGVLCMLLPAFFIAPVRFYSAMGGYMGMIFLALTLLCIIILLSAYLYVYPIMVTFDLKLKQIIRNSIIMAFANFPVNLFILVVCALILYGSTMIPVQVMVILMFLIIPATISFISVFGVWGMIDKYMMPEKTDDEEEAVFSDERILK